MDRQAPGAALAREVKDLSQELTVRFMTAHRTSFAMARFNDGWPLMRPIASGGGDEQEAHFVCRPLLLPSWVT